MTGDTKPLRSETVDKVGRYVRSDSSRAVNTPRNSVLLVAAFIVTAVLTVLNVAFFYHLAILITIFSVTAVSLDVLSGYTGQVSVLHAGFMGISAYTTAYMTTHYRLTVWAGVFVGTVLVTIIGISIGYMAFQTSGHYFVLTTLAIAALFTTVFTVWEPVTGGPAGFSGIISPTLDISLGGVTAIDFGSNRGYFYLSMTVLVLTMVAINNILNSRIGRSLIAVRENEQLARSHGINTKKAKLTGLGISCFFTGLAGGLYAHYVGYIQPSMFGFFPGFEILIMTMIGGMGTLVGPIFGAAFIELVPEVLRDYPQLSDLVFGLALLAVVLYLPQGIWGVLRSLWK